MNNKTSENKKKYIEIIGAKLHNLKNVSVKIPHNKLTVITGLSGSGKSTLAFDTIYAEGQRRFVESLSSYARQFLERMGKPDVESISGIPPAIAIEQKTSSRNPRSTVGTSTEVYDYFRLLFGRIGTTICKNCGKVVKKDSPQSVVEELLGFEEGNRLYIMFALPPQVRNINEELQKYLEFGYFRVVIGDSDSIVEFQNEELPKGITPEQVYVLVDRVIMSKEKETITRLTDSIEAAFRSSNGRISIRNLSTKETKYFSSNYECADCEIVYQEPDPKIFSFNNPQGACPSCQGFGKTIGIDEDLIIPDKTKSLRKDAIHPFRTPSFSALQRDLLKAAAKHNINVDEPYEKLPEEAKSLIWNGTKGYAGINGFFKHLEDNSYKMHFRITTARYRGYTTCAACGGSRLRTSARQVFVQGKSIPDIVKMPLDEVLDFVNNLKLNKTELEIAGQILKELKWRLQLLVDIGLHYLSLDRLSHTLSGGESQRINLSTALGSSLVGTLYVLDEPSIGMHPRDTDRLLNVLYKLRNLGNTIVVVEHDPDIIRNADEIIDLGPLAGEHGGEIMYAGKAKEILNCENSLTGQYLAGKKNISIPEKRRQPNGSFLEIRNARKHNLKIDRLQIPLSCMTVVTGVSGSGKSTLILDILYEGLKKNKQNGSTLNGMDYILGADNIEQVELVDQTPIGRSSRSTPISYSKAFDIIREIFAGTQPAKQLGLKPGYFSFNVPGGRCETCEGEGTISVDMQFLPDVRLECEACKGTRYKKEARSILYKGKSIVDVLNMTIDEAIDFFKDNTRLVKKLIPFRSVGLGYIRLGQPSSMLSGGESQRVKLATHLESGKNSNTLFIFDEPTTGLHIHDVSMLINCFEELVQNGHSVIIIEHNLHVISSADWLIDLGPEAGENGGRVIATGSPEKLATVKHSHTGKALKDFFERNKE